MRLRGSLGVHTRSLYGGPAGRVLSARAQHQGLWALWVPQQIAKRT